MIPHIYILFEFISIPYENQHQTLNIKKIDRGQIKFREYSITLLQPSQARCQCSRHNQKNVIGRNLFVSFMGVAWDENGGRGLQQQQGRGRRVWGRRNIFRRNIRRNLSLVFGVGRGKGGGSSGRGRSRRNICRSFMYLKPGEIKLKKLKKIIFII